MSENIALMIGVSAGTLAALNQLTGLLTLWLYLGNSTFCYWSINSFPYYSGYVVGPLSKQAGKASTLPALSMERLRM